jgi:hypothetical protein
MLTPLEECLTTNYKDGMIAFLKAHPECWDEAIELAVTNKQPYSWRAAWLLWSCLTKNDTRIHPHIDDLIQAMEGKKDGHQREILKILLVMELNEEQESKLLDFCIQEWKQTQKTPSIRYTAFRFMYQMAKKYPELSQEIKLYTQKHYLESLSPGVRKSIYKMIETL